jgi:hypothetical protein
VSDGDTQLRAFLQTLDPKARDDLRRVLIREHADRDDIASQLMRYRDENGQRWADIIDMLTMYPDVRRQVTGSSARWRRAANKATPGPDGAARTRRNR